MEQAKVHIDTQHTIAKIDKRVYSGFLEHLGRAVYEGVYDPGNPLSNAQGFRKDVLEALRPLEMPLVRYPGGNFVSGYDWTDGIGPREQRPTRPDFAWHSLETNQFGTDEFMQWCVQQGTSPMMAVNLGTGSTSGAAALLEYCNLPTGTYWANLRAKNAQAEPYNVRTWCLGNEMDGEWQAGHVPADVYAQRANQASKMMKGLDPSIETIACGSSNYTMATYLSWDREVLEYCWNTIDYLSVHRYSNNNRNDSAWFLAEGVEIDRVLEDYSGLLAYVRGVKKSNKNVYLSFDEWNVWYKNMEMDGHGQSAPHLLEEVYNLEDALVCAQYLNSFIRHADVVKIACLAQITNVIAPVLTRPEGLLKQSIYYPFVLFSQYANGISLTPSIQSPMYQAGERGSVPALDASVSYDEQSQTATFFLVNRQQSEELVVDLEIADLHIGEVLSVDLLGGGDVKAANTWEQPDLIKPVAGKAELLDNGSVRVIVPAPGLAVVHTSLKTR
jgi:alpha-L-arabinofuranosidase